MSRWLREVRIIPIVLIAVGCLFALKAGGLWLEGGYTLGQRLSRGDTITITTLPASNSTQLQSQTSPLELASSHTPGQRRSWAQEMFGYPDVTGSVGTTKEPTKVADKQSPKDVKDQAAKPAAKDAAAAGKDQAVAGKEPVAAGKEQAAAGKEPAKSGAPQTKPATGAERPVDIAARPDPARPSAAERAILERLLERRQELDAKARELELRENLVKAAEKNLEEKLAAIKAKETGPNAGRPEAEAARFKGLITMYETMKPKEAAKIFDRLDIKVLVEVASQINPRRMSEIMAQMSPESAEKLTMEFASRGEGDRSPKPADLPKIDGKPAGG
jgi:flagellar motility protein MotE (MotC chaperone)